MSSDEKQGTSVNFDLTIDDILAELDLLPSEQSTQPSGSTEKAEPVQPAPVAGKVPPAVSPASDPTSPVQPIKQTTPVSPSPSVARPAPVPAAQERDGESNELEEVLEEPATMVFSPQPKATRQARRSNAGRQATASSGSPRRAIQPAPRPGSLREELARLSRTEGGHSMTEELRAKDPQIIPAGGGKPGRPAAPMTATLVSGSAKHSIDWKREILEWGRSLLIAAAIIFFIFFVLIRLVNVEGSSMSPSLEEGDRLVISNLFYSPENGDIVVTSADNGLSKPLIKRVIAVAGQTVDLNEEGEIMVNGLVVDEPYIGDAVTEAGDLTFPVTVPEGCVFLLGDNRENSTDSRSNMVGFVDEDEIKGQVLFRFFPFNRIGTVE